MKQLFSNTFPGLCKYMIIPLLNNVPTHAMYNFNSLKVRVPFEVCNPVGVIIEDNQIASPENMVSSIQKLNKFTLQNWSNVVNNDNYIYNHLYKPLYLKSKIDKQPLNSSEKFKHFSDELIVDVINNSYNLFTINSNNRYPIYVLFTNFCDNSKLFNLKFVLNQDKLELSEVT